MGAVIMSNPGLHLAVLGNPQRSKKRKGKKMATKKQKAAARRNIKKAHAANRLKANRTYAKKARGYTVKRRKGSKRKSSAKFNRKTGIRSGRYGNYVFSQGGKKVATNPRKRKSRKRNLRSTRRRRNPISVGGFYDSVKSAPGAIMQAFTGENKVKNIGYLAGGTVAAYFAGGFTSKLLSPVLAKIPGAAGMLQKPTVQGAVGFVMNAGGAYVISNFIKDKDIKTAIRLGGVAAGLLELVAPGKIGELVNRLPFFGQVAQAAPIVAAASEGATNGLAAYYGTELAGFVGEYVDASAYQGAGEYVDASAYQGAGEYVDASAYQGAGDDDALAEYVDASAYQGAGDDDALAGSYLDEADMFQSYL